MKNCTNKKISNVTRQEWQRLSTYLIHSTQISAVSIYSEEASHVESLDLISTDDRVISYQERYLPISIYQFSDHVSPKYQNSS